MIYKRLDGELFRNLLDYGIRNLSLHCEEVNALNVFPVPDGDTGTNMVTTLRNGYAAMDPACKSLAEASRQFSGTVVYGARGNSGVIVSQFFKGFSESFFHPEEKDTAGFHEYIAALEQGVRFAYDAVSHPTEGTILTVIREATEYVARSGVEQNGGADFTDLLRLFLRRAKISLENTPNLLPVLKQAGVVDSGAMGIIYVFEGMLKYLTGETIEAPAEVHPATPVIDYAGFDPNSTFDFGYCTEFLLQTLAGAEALCADAFKQALEELGDSLVCSVEQDKVKVHIHTPFPERVLALAHRYGEFLSLKIENMNVQHTARGGNQGNVVNVSQTKSSGAFAVVAVSQSDSVTKLLESMGVDVVISLAESDTPSAQDFVDAFGAAGQERIIVFPNHPNYVMTAEQACDLYGKGNVVVLRSKSIADCYASLALVDFLEEDFGQVVSDINKVIDNVYAVRLTVAARDAVYADRALQRGDVIALHGASLLAVGKDLETVARQVISDVMEQEERDTVTVFRGSGIAQESVDAILDFIEEQYVYTEANLVVTEDANGDLILSFE